VRIAIVGCGYWGHNHLRLMRQSSHVEKIVVVEPDPVSRARLAYISGIDVVSDLTSALSVTDAAIIATPPRTHAAVALECLTAGKDVLVEKPLATSLDEAQRLVELAADRGLTLMVGHTFEYNAGVRKLRDLMQSGELGDTYYIDCARLNLGRYQSDVNVIWDLAPHDISIANYLLNREPSQVQAWGAANVRDGVEDVATLRLKYESPNIVVQICLSWLAPQKVRRVTVVGSRKMAVYDDLLDDERIKVFDKHAEAPQLGDGDGLASVTYHNGGVMSPYVQFEEPLRVLDEHFLECLEFGLPVQTPGESGLSVVRVIEAAQSSLCRGGAAVAPSTDADSSLGPMTSRLIASW
jgi:predicted dehydrogenase